jgi:hypothetical protein
MIILYIPFYEKNDLIDKALAWKSTDTDKKILIIQHGKDIDYKAITDENHIVYILAHGIDDLNQHSYHLASNNLITNKTTCLGIERIAERFNLDFTYVHSRIKNIKLYFCNNKGNQKAMAERFSNNLVQLFNPQVDYYAGTLYSPFKNKKKYSQYFGLWYPTSKVRGTIYPNASNNELEPRLNIKKRDMLAFFENAKQKRFDSVGNSSAPYTKRG